MTCKQLYEDYNTYTDKTVLLKGWIKRKRTSANIGFFELSDGSMFETIQLVFDKELENFEELDRLALQSCIEVEGKLIVTPDAKQPFEIQTSKIEVLFEADKDYPLQTKRHSLEFLRSILHLRPRTNTFMAVFRVRSLMSQAIHEFFNSRDFVYVHTPLITSTDAEGAGELFRVTTLEAEDFEYDDEGRIDYSKDFFGKGTYLTVSGQLAVEPFALSFGNVYTFGPTFRSENSHTARHASEFWMVEPEMSFCDLECNMQVAEDMMKYIVSYVLEKAPQEMAFFNQFVDKTLLERLNNLLAEPFARVTYTKAIEILLESGREFKYPVEWGCDLQTEHERYLAEDYFGKPVFVTDYPAAIKAFYMKKNPDGKTVRAMDLLVPGVGEIIGGSQREDDYDTLKAAIEERGMAMENYEWYLDLRRYGSAVHSGYGLGLERAVQYITGMSNIRDVIPYPRTPGNAEF
ncbi:MAG: asparagine--tRNA ligase [Tissierellia bacterium]|nr:asparagine--tRNA ligase [Tissierellia bacterium]